MDEDKLTDDDLKRHRVGGRLVTRKEILRSKKCPWLFPHLRLFSPGPQSSASLQSFSGTSSTPTSHR